MRRGSIRLLYHNAVPKRRERGASFCFDTGKTLRHGGRADTHPLRDRRLGLLEPIDPNDDLAVPVAEGSEKYPDRALIRVSSKSCSISTAGSSTGWLKTAKSSESGDG